MAVPFDFADTATSDIWSYKKVLRYFLFSLSAKLDNIFNCQKWNYSFPPKFSSFIEFVNRDTHLLLEKVSNHFVD